MLATHPSVDSDTTILDALATYERDKAPFDQAAARSIDAVAEADASATAASATRGLGAGNEKMNATNTLVQQGTTSPAAQHASAGNKAAEVAPSDESKDKVNSSQRKDRSRKNDKEKYEPVKKDNSKKNNRD